MFLAPVILFGYDKGVTFHQYFENSEIKTKAK